jgi:hypothetical protein
LINKLLISSSGSASTTTTNGHAVYNLAGFTNGRDVIKNGNDVAHNKYGEGGAHKYQNGVSKGNTENAKQLNGGGKEISRQTI